MGKKEAEKSSLIVKLPVEPQTVNELQTVTDIVNHRKASEVILDLSRLETVTCTTLCQLVKLKKVITDVGGRFILCKLNAMVRGIFITYGFDSIFKGIVKDIVTLEPWLDQDKGGIITFTDSGRHPQRRNYSRLNIPKKVRMDLTLTYSEYGNINREVSKDSLSQEVALVDISKDGVQIAIETEGKTNFQKGRFVQLDLAVPSIEKEAKFNAQIRNVSTTADEKNICLGAVFGSGSKFCRP